MRNISESLFKILAIIFCANGLQSLLGMFAANTVNSGQDCDTPLILYFSSLLPVLIGALVWVLSPTLTPRSTDDTETLSINSVVSVGCFMLGIYYITINLPTFVFTLTAYLELSKIPIASSSFANDKLQALKIISARLVVGILLIAFSAKISKAFLALRRHGQ